MREHLIPQDITGYKFHIIGSMTIGQFAQILLGVALAFIFYKTNLPGIIKWPISICCVLLGFMGAFVPIEGRPLSDWIVNFAKALYKPTKFFWQKTPQIPAAFKYEPNREVSSETTMIDVSPIKKEKIKQFLQSINQFEEDLDQFDLAENQRVSAIVGSFQDVQVVSEPIPQETKPDLKIRTRKVAPFSDSFLVYQQEIADKKTLDNINQPTDLLQDDFLNSQQVAVEKDSDQSQDNQVAQTPHNATIVKVASQRQDLPFPNKPTQPNKIVGMILTLDNNLIGDALVELKNSEMQTITAVKSNALGQFQISQGLNNGRYFIQVQKEGLEFNPQQIELTGVILDPVEIVAN